MSENSLKVGIIGDCLPNQAVTASPIKSEGFATELFTTPEATNECIAQANDFFAVIIFCDKERSSDLVKSFLDKNPNIHIILYPQALFSLDNFPEDQIILRKKNNIADIEKVIEKLIELREKRKKQ